MDNNDRKFMFAIFVVFCAVGLIVKFIDKQNSKRTMICTAKEVKTETIIYDCEIKKDQ